MADVQNSKRTAKKDIPGVPFPKGKSGNPGGRPKMPVELKEACKAFTPEGIEILISIAQNTKARDGDRIRAIECILDRGYGKPQQSVEVDAKSIPQVVFVGGDLIAD